MVEAIRGPRAVVGIRRRLVLASVPSWERAWQRYFAGLARRFGAYARSHMTRRKAADDPADLDVGGFAWDDEADDLRTMLNAQYAQMIETVWTDVVGEQTGTALRFDLNARNVRRVLDRVGTRITGINRTSQERIAGLVAREIEKSSNADVLERAIGDLLRSWGEDGGRAHVIAMTETANAYNEAAVAGYREVGLEQVEVYDGPDCGWTEHDDPDLADGSTRTLDEADEYPEAHPHCQRAFGPVTLTEQ